MEGEANKRHSSTVQFEGVQRQKWAQVKSMHTQRLHVKFETTNITDIPQVISLSGTGGKQSREFTHTHTGNMKLPAIRLRFWSCWEPDRKSSDEADNLFN